MKLAYHNCFSIKIVPYSDHLLFFFFFFFSEEMVSRDANANYHCAEIHLNVQHDRFFIIYDKKRGHVAYFRRE